MAKEIITHHGPQAQEGDYVLVIYDPPMSSAVGLIGKVHNGKAYTGYKTSYRDSFRYCHRLVAECVVPAEWVTDEKRASIEEDIRVSTAPKAKKAVSGDD